MTRLLLFFTVSFLLACTHVPFSVKDSREPQQADGLYQYKVELVAQAQSYICFVELANQQMSGLSCQNELGFAEFSGGQTDKGLVLELTNPTLNKAQAQFIVDLLRLSVFEQYALITKDKLTITKKKGNIEIMNADNQLLFRVSQ